MYLSNPAKSFLAALLFLFSTAGCGVLKPDQNTAAPLAEEPKSRFPFRTKEPENFQCEIVETAGTVVRRKRLAKKGTWRRLDLDLGEKDQRTLLQTDKEYLLDAGRGVYAEVAPAAGGNFSELTHELLNAGEHSDFEETGRDGDTVRYTVRPANGAAGEIVVHFDESIGLPVKQEFVSIDGDTRSVEFMIELVNFTYEPAADAFSIPSGYKRVSVDELLRAMHT